MSQNNVQRRILLVEDNCGDQFLLREALAALAEELVLDIVGDGEAAIRFLRGDAPFEFAKIPDLILLDMNLPKKSGLEVLTEIRADQKTAHLSVLMLSTSMVPADIECAKRLKVLGYIVKAFDVDEYFRRVHGAVSAWMRGDSPEDFAPSLHQ